MIALILNAIPAPVWAAIVGMVALAVAWLKGRSDGARGVKTKAAAKAADDLQTANEVQNDNAAKSGDAVRDDLAKWMRDK
jgi:hypothetical protein